MDMGPVIMAQASSTTLFVGILLALLAGVGGTLAVIVLRNKSRHSAAQQEVARLIEEGRRDAAEITRAAEVEAKAKYLEQQNEFDQKTAAARNEIREAEKRLDKREDILERKLDMLTTKEKQVEAGEVRIRTKQAETDKKAVEIAELLARQRNELLKIAQLPLEEARKQLF